MLNVAEMGGTYARGIGRGGRRGARGGTPTAAAAVEPGNVAAVPRYEVAAASGVMLDPAPPVPPWEYHGGFGVLGACEATGRSWVNSGRYVDYTCRAIGSLWRLYLLPGLPGCFADPQLASCPVAPRAARD